ncbi:Protein disulfide isomerase [Mycena sanguinolenta]|uniref:Protein disulfide isomerase n=1 Tax=Mycena sanguinolenta TaxID=230812 RepID=A0A8H6XLE3_9AGAR|nr:Protein disulfide isomerase [Mycena sanguinolenta]
MLIGLCRLPASLLLTSLSLISLISLVLASTIPQTENAIPDSKRPFTLHDYHSGALTKGVWFIQCFSPYCGHCRKFSPTWEKLVEHSGVPTGVQFARVDCSVNGELCNALGVVGYPQLNLYRDSVFMDKYQGRRDLDLLVKYLALHVSTSETPSLSMPAGSNSPGTAVVKSPLTEDTFHPTIAKGPWVVLYSTPWCGQCERFALTWEKLRSRARCSPACSLPEWTVPKARIRGYPTLNLYGDGDLLGTYYGRDFDTLTKYFVDTVPAPTPPPIPNPDGEVTVLTPSNFPAMIAWGPAFVSFIPQHCRSSDQCRPEYWRTLATAMRGSTTIAEVNCGGIDDLGFCNAHGITLGAATEPTLVYFSRDDSPGVEYTGPRTLMQLKAFIKVGGIYPPPAMEFKQDTWDIVKAQPITVMASPGTDSGQRRGPHTRDCARVDDGIVRLPRPEDVGVIVYIVDHDEGSPGYGKIYLTEGHVEEGTEPQPLKLTAESIFSVLVDVAGSPRLSSSMQETEKLHGCHSLAQQAMQACLFALLPNSSILTDCFHSISTLPTLYVVLQRFLKAQSDVEPRDDEDLEVFDDPSVSNFTKFVLLSTTLALHARAGPSPAPLPATGDSEPVVPTVPFFVPTAANLIFNTTVPQGVNATLGWVSNNVGDDSNPVAFDGSQKKHHCVVHAPGRCRGVRLEVCPIERVLCLSDCVHACPTSIGVGPGPDGFCGIFPGFVLKESIDSSVLGTYTGRWVIEYGQSTRPDAPVGPESGCGPLPFNMTTTEFVRTWEVVAA